MLQSGQEPVTLDTLTRADVADAVEHGLATAGPVRKLLHAMAEAGCPVDRGFFHVLRCSAAVGGGFAPEHGVILCHNRLHTRREVLNAMAHELIHAYDHCRYGGRVGAGAEPSGSGASASPGDGGDGGGGAALTSGACDAAASAAPTARSSGSSEDSSHCGGSGSPRSGGLDWSDCRQHACTEIRAANLSGDCSLLQELLRGNLPLLPLGWAAQQRACVARRAALSVAMNPACGTREAAAAVVAEMMPACLADTAPLDASEAVATPP
ncbi:hypothetical protein PLESTF_001253300 [Pleodorina starrii]|nr:hypothetical protein PLESTM_000396700 [Pleodorina starrii]GLC72491.1 hypothetical protein PLESTF_001253300 [Pleodorina starrii]